MLGLKPEQVSHLTYVLDISDILAETAAYTPDVWELESKQYHFIFVVDDTMKGFRNHHLVSCGASGSDPFYPCYSADKFSFLYKELSLNERKLIVQLPFLGLDRDDLPPWMQKQHRIRGELYALRGCSIIDLDNHYQNGVRFQRIAINVNIPYFKRHVTRSQTYNGVWSVDYHRSKDYIITVKAWMYVPRLEYWLDQLLNPNIQFKFNRVPTQQVDRVWISEFYNYPRQF